MGCSAVGVAHTAMDAGGDGKRKPRVQEDGSGGQQRGWYLGSGENLASQEMGGRGRGGGPYVNEHFYN